MNNPVAEVKPIPLGPLPERPLVSILMPNYNYAKYIGEAIESVLAQTYPHWELIVCDDGSTDNSPEIVRKYQKRDPRIKLICKENGGVASALNAAYAASEGQIIALLDSDDAFLPEKIEQVVATFQQTPEFGLVVHRMCIVDARGTRKGVIPIFTRFESGYLADKLYRRGGRWRHMPASAIALRREVCRFVFPLNEERFHSVADAFIFTFAPLITSVHGVDSTLAIYRLHGSNLTGGVDFTTHSIRKTLCDLERCFIGVNERCQALGLPRIDLERNLDYQEYKYFLHLLDRSHSFSQCFSGYISLVKLTLSDDLYSTQQKFGAMVAYLLALLVPLGMRPLVLRAFVSPARWKYWLKAVASRLRSIQKLRAGLPCG